MTDRLFVEFLSDLGAFISEWADEHAQDLEDRQIEQIAITSRKREDQRFYPWLEVQELTQICARQNKVEQYVKSKYFPRWHHVEGRTKYWKKAEVLDWLKWRSERPYRSTHRRWLSWKKANKSKEVYTFGK